MQTDELPHLEALKRSVAIVNDKGGVGKTSIAANVGGQVAAAGYRVLLVDLNRQGNLGLDLGYDKNREINDDGEGLLFSVLKAEAGTPCKNIRENLDVIPGGDRLGDLTPLMVARAQTEGRHAYLALHKVLGPIAGSYDLVLIDSPPENITLTDLALGAARWVLMPTKTDAGGLKGMTLVAKRFQIAREINPQVSLLGAVLFATGSTYTGIHREVRAAVAEAFGGRSPLFSSIIRASESTAQASRRDGRLAHELEVDAAQQPAWWEALRRGEKAPSSRISSTVSNVASDYQKLAIEILTALRKAEEAEEAMVQS